MKHKSCIVFHGSNLNWNRCIHRELQRFLSQLFWKRSFCMQLHFKALFQEIIIIIIIIIKIQLVVCYQCCVLIGWATTRLYSSEKRRFWKPWQWRLNRVLLAKVVLSRYFWPTSWILLKKNYYSCPFRLWVNSPFGLIIIVKDFINVSKA